ncbi:winged helix-turn-helix domain-containing protein [Serratia fonticola]|uniref:winged helix-turn-helix domain-containing protein n=1 Tax=Serratia fonticola TaxID=47917 RepID=UPI003AF3CAEE
MNGCIISDSKKYLIENTIIFIPGNGFYLPASEKTECKISLVSDRMLVLLIELQGRIVSKKEIQSYLWDEFSIDVSTASLNNNLSDLRFYLKKMKIGDLIVTTPRVGLSIRPEAKIIRLDDVTTKNYEDVYLDITPILDNRTGGTKKVFAIFVLMTLIFILFFDK